MSKTLTIMPSQCEQLKQEYETIKSLKTEFDSAYQEAVETGKLEKAKELKNKIESRISSLREKLWSFEYLPQKELRKQYESQRMILERVKILKKLSNGEMGIKAIGNQEYAFPKLEEVSKMMRENQEILKTKTEQGFQKLLIVPFGMKLNDLIKRYKQVILKHHQEGKLFTTKEDLQEPNQPLELDEKQPVWVWDKYLNADISGDLVYFPQEFSQNHQGKTKQAILKEQGGFNILLIEDLPNIPRESKGKTVGKRKQFEANQTPNEYLKALQTELMYQNEQGMTPEDQLTYAITYLEETNQVIDDWQGHGSVSYQVGAYFPASGDVPRAYWNRSNRRAGLAGRDPGDHSDLCSVRAGVRVSRL